MNPNVFAPLSALYRAMDDAFGQTARQYGFICRGCEDNCCKSLFFHHTFVEKAYLIHGFFELSPPRKDAVVQKARGYADQTFSGENGSHQPQSLGLMCPLNENGKCSLYTFRPMICRLHGLPHEFLRPDGRLIKGLGCAAGEFDKQAYISFDRTPFYQELARVELQFRQQHQKTGKLKQTVAQIILDSQA